MNSQDIWNSDKSVTDVLGFIGTVPHWIDQDIGISTVASIMQGGCNSGAYMPAVTYYRALATMGNFGDDVMDYIQQQLGETPAPSAGESWGGMACHYLSLAVELWAGDIYYRLEGLDDE
jgi:hypothetical protein